MVFFFLNYHKHRSSMVELKFWIRKIFENEEESERERVGKKDGNKSDEERQRRKQLRKLLIYCEFKCYVNHHHVYHYILLFQSEAVNMYWELIVFEHRIEYWTRIISKNNLEIKLKWLSSYTAVLSNCVDITILWYWICSFCWRRFIFSNNW